MPVFNIIKEGQVMIKQEVVYENRNPLESLLTGLSPVNKLSHPRASLDR